MFKTYHLLIAYHYNSVLAGSSFGGGRGGGICLSQILKKSDFLCFCSQNFVFFIFCPRSKFCSSLQVGQNFAPPLEKYEMTSLRTILVQYLLFVISK